MATGYHAFANNELLTAQKVNDYLMRQVVISVDDSTQRDAITSPFQGMLVFRRDLGLIEEYSAIYNSATNLAGRTAAGWYPVAVNLQRKYYPAVTATVIASGAAFASQAFKRRPYKQRIIVTVAGGAATASATTYQMSITASAGGTNIVNSAHSSNFAASTTVNYARIAVIEIAAGVGADVTITCAGVSGAGNVSFTGQVIMEVLAEGEW